MVSFSLNDQRVSVDADPGTPLLWVIREHVGLTGTKYGCGAALCGACTVHVDGAATRSCATPVSAVADRKVTTIEGLSAKVWVAVDGGTIVQPAAAKANIESGIIYGLSSVLHERATVKDGKVEQSNFHDYTVMRMSDLPEEMHVSFVEVDTRPTGIGEIGNPWVAAAVANAFHNLTGKRLYHMPFTPERVLAALKA